METPTLPRQLASLALGLPAGLLCLELLGGRRATVALTGALGPTAPLGLLYVLVWLLTVTLAPPLLLTLAIEALALTREARARTMRRSP